MFSQSLLLLSGEWVPLNAWTLLTPSECASGQGPEGAAQPLQQQHMKAALLLLRRLHTPQVTEETGPQRTLPDDSALTLWFNLAREDNSMGWRPRNAQMMCPKHVAPKHGLYSWTHLPFPPAGTFKKIAWCEAAHSASRWLVQTSPFVASLHHSSAYLSHPAFSLPTPWTKNFLLVWKSATLVHSFHRQRAKEVKMVRVQNPGVFSTLGCLLQYLPALK